MFANFEIMLDYAERDEMPPLEMRHMMRFQSASVADRCVKLAEAMLTVSGGGGVYDKSEMGRIYRNMITGRQHAAAQHRIYGRTYGDLMFGGEPYDIFL